MTVLEADVAGESLAEPRARAGTRALSLLATPLNGLVLRALADEPMRLARLQAAVGSPSQSTLRGHIAKLTDLGAISKRRCADGSESPENELSPLGFGLLIVADAVKAWLTEAPDDAIPLDTERGKRVVKALSGGWDSAILHALAAGSLSLAELDRQVSDLSYPTLKRRLSALDSIGLVEALASPRARALYAVTEWGRRAIAPVVAAIRCERRYLAEATAPIADVDVQAAFLLSLPLVSLSKRLGGDCVLVVDTGSSREERRVAGIRVGVEKGEVLSVAGRLGKDPSNWALGTTESWFAAVGDGKTDRLRIGGANPALPRAFVLGIHRAFAL